MTDEMHNIGEFKKACEDFDVSFINTDDRQTKQMAIDYSVNGQRVLREDKPINFIHSVNYCKVDIGNYERLNIHGELSTQWQDFEYKRDLKELNISGSSKQYNHNYLVKISLPELRG